MPVQRLLNKKQQQFHNEIGHELCDPNFPFKVLGSGCQVPRPCSSSSTAIPLITNLPSRAEPTTALLMNFLRINQQMYKTVVVFVNIFLRQISLVAQFHFKLAFYHHKSSFFLRAPSGMGRKDVIIRMWGAFILEMIAFFLVKCSLFFCRRKESSKKGL